MSSDVPLDDSSTPRQSVEDSGKAPHGPADWLRWLGERRDGFIVGGAVLYGLGYLVWSYNAWRNELGQLPAAEFQYFMAGIVPAAIIATAWSAAVFFATLEERVRELSKRYRAFKWVVLLVVIVLGLLVSLLPFVASRGWINTDLTDEQFTRRYAPPLMAIAMYVSLFSNVALTQNRLWVVRFIAHVYRYALPVLFGWFSLVLYFDIYPRLPQALGGPQPRCAYVDLVRDEIAPSSLSRLASKSLDPQEGDSPSKVVRSGKLRVYFSNSDSLLVRTSQEDSTSNAGATDATLYELRNEVIRIVHWCGAD
jgi:hypothetical protein